MGIGDTQRVGSGALARSSQIVTIGGSLAADGTPAAGASFLPPGRAAATASVPTVLSNEDKASLDRADGVYLNNALYAGATTAGDGVAFSITGAGTVNFVQASGTMTLAFPIGSYTVPYACTNVTAGTATGLVAYKLGL